MTSGIRRIFILAASLLAMLSSCAPGHEKTAAARMDLYVSWGDGDGTTDFRVKVDHEMGSCLYGFNQNHTPGRHFVGSFYTGPSTVVTGENASDAEKEALPFEYEWVPTEKRSLVKKASETLSVVSMNIGDELEYVLKNGESHHITLLSTDAEVTKYGLDDVDGKTERVFEYKFSADFLIDGDTLTLSKVTPSNSDTFAPAFYVKGMMLYLDAVMCIFEDAGGFMGEKDAIRGITCRPRRDARIVLRDETSRAFPGTIYPWFVGAERWHKKWICYHGRDCWMGTWAEGGNCAHGGLDINMPDGTILYCPIDVDDQYFFQSVATGANNNRWRGVKTFSDGTTWWIQAHHINTLLPGIEEHTPMKAGTPYAETAGTYIGRYEHTHFCLRVFDSEEDNWIDPWLLMRDSSR